MPLLLPRSADKPHAHRLDGVQRRAMPPHAAADDDEIVVKFPILGGLCHDGRPQDATGAASDPLPARSISVRLTRRTSGGRTSIAGLG